MLRAPAILVCLLAVRAAAAAPSVSFNRDVRPILSDRCFACHGPDAARRQADLRLDRPLVATKARILSPGRPESSELVRRVTSLDPRRRMPPAAHGPALSAREIRILRQWVGEGAPWDAHWSFLPPRRPPVPRPNISGWAVTPIDSFLLDRMEASGLRPSRAAGRETLIRRLSLDLTGLPPAPEEVDAFLSDRRPGAYERLVDRLLASPHFGERMALPWLEAARYADTNGYQSDGERSMWRWRDWVIDSLNRNMPFDRFTIDQLAGDLLPNATLEQKIATGFNRNHRGNGEGGIIPEEYLVEYVADRVETTGAVWLGLTLTCSRCHDHKYDPIRQREFYRLFAYFNNVPEKGRANKYGNSPPMIAAPTRDQQTELNRLDAEIAAATADLAGEEASLASARLAWVRELSRGPDRDWRPEHGLLYDRSPEGSPGGPDAPVPWWEFPGRGVIEAGDRADFGFYDRFSLSAWVQGEAPGGTVLSRVADAERGEGYSLVLQGGRVQFNLVKRWLDDALRVETAQPVARGWRHILATYDGSRAASGVRVFVDGVPVRLTVLLDELNQSFQNANPLRIGGGGGTAARFRGRIGPVRVYGRVLADTEARMLADSRTLVQAARESDSRSPLAARLIHAYRELAAPASLRARVRRLRELEESRLRYLDGVPTVMVMEEMPRPRATHVLLRGAYDRPGERVAAGVPAALHPLPERSPPNRLGLARWLVDRRNPLTARVTVNRFWQMLFGTGLVRTVEDFGAQGEWPTHPELLDWLAVDFMDSGWDVKRLIRLIVTSAAYRQAGAVNANGQARDPANRLLWRFPRIRLPAETIRDQALAASGLLVRRIGGPSVRPYQPAGLWKELSGGEDYVQETGESLYRRSLYTFWKRTSAPPGLAIFDAANRETCVVRESRTNTPLQALNLMNDTAYLEAARKIAERAMQESSGADESLDRMFRLVLVRRPAPREREALRAAYGEHLSRFQASPADARALLSQGASPRADLPPAAHAALAAIAGTLLNLDETVTRE